MQCDKGEAEGIDPYGRPLGDYITSMPCEQQEDRRKIRTFTGRYINPFTVRARDISLRDIAHHLSLINRYTGASPWPCPVAQHSVLVAERAARQWNEAGGHVSASVISHVVTGSPRI